MPILVVEGNHHVRDVITSILEIEGYEVVLASSGIEGLHLLRRTNDITLALVDVTEPTLDGWRLCHTVLTNQMLAVPLVMMTEAIPRGYLPVGPSLRKPFGMSELLETVRAHLRGPRRRKRVRAFATPTGSANTPRQRVS